MPRSMSRAISVSPYAEGVGGSTTPSILSPTASATPTSPALAAIMDRVQEMKRCADHRQWSPPPSRVHKLDTKTQNECASRLSPPSKSLRSQSQQGRNGIAAVIAGPRDLTGRQTVSPALQRLEDERLREAQKAERQRQMSGARVDPVAFRRLYSRPATPSILEQCKGAQMNQNSDIRLGSSYHPIQDLGDKKNIQILSQSCPAAYKYLELQSDEGIQTNDESQNDENVPRNDSLPPPPPLSWSSASSPVAASQQSRVGIPLGWVGMNAIRGPSNNHSTSSELVSLLNDLNGSMNTGNSNYSHLGNPSTNGPNSTLTSLPNASPTKSYLNSASMTTKSPSAALGHHPHGFNESSHVLPHGLGSVLGQNPSPSVLGMAVLHKTSAAVKRLGSASWKPLGVRSPARSMLMRADPQTILNAARQHRKCDLPAGGGRSIDWKPSYVAEEDPHLMWYFRRLDKRNKRIGVSPLRSVTPNPARGGEREQDSPHIVISPHPSSSECTERASLNAERSYDDANDYSNE